MTWDLVQVTSLSLFFSLCLTDLYVDLLLQSLCLRSLWKSTLSSAHRSLPTQLCLGREREEGRQEPPLGYTWGAPCSGRSVEGFACKSLLWAFHRTQGHRNNGMWLTWRVSAQTGVWLWFCIHHTCSGTWEYRDDIPWHFMRSMCHKAKIKVDIQLTWRWIACHKRWWHYITNDAKFSWHCRDIEQCRLCNRIRSSFSKRWPKS